MLYQKNNKNNNRMQIHVASQALQIHLRKKRPSPMAAQAKPAFAKTA